MRNLPENIEQYFFDTIYGKVALREFEEWVYTNKEIEFILGEDDYLELISFNYLNHILDCIIKIQVYTDGIDEDKFFNNSLVQDGVIRNLEVIGEAKLKKAGGRPAAYNIIQQLPHLNLSIKTNHKTSFRNFA